MTVVLKAKKCIISITVRGKYANIPLCIQRSNEDMTGRRCLATVKACFICKERFCLEENAFRRTRYCKWEYGRPFRDRPFYDRKDYGRPTYYGKCAWSDKGSTYSRPHSSRRTFDRRNNRQICPRGGTYRGWAAGPVSGWSKLLIIRRCYYVFHAKYLFEFSFLSRYNTLVKKTDALKLKEVYEEEQIINV